MKTTSTARGAAPENPVSTASHERQICVKKFSPKNFPKRGAAAFKKPEIEKSQQLQNNIMNTTVPINSHTDGNQCSVVSAAVCSPAGTAPEFSIDAVRRHFFDGNFDLQNRHWFFAAARARRKGVKDPELLASEVMDSLRRTYDPAFPFKPYFNTAVRRRIACALRKQQRQNQREVPLPEDFDVTFASPRPAQVSPELGEAVEKAMRRLRPELRELFRLRFWRDHDCAEVGRIKGLTTSAVSNRLSRTYSKVRRLLAEWNPALRAARSAASAKQRQRPIAALRQAPAPFSSASCRARRRRRPVLAVITSPVRNQKKLRCPPGLAA